MLQKDTPTQHDLIIQCYPVVQRCAQYYSYNHHLQPTDCDDLISTAMLYIVEHAADARTKDNPVAWLINCAKHQMREAYYSLSTHNMCANWYQRKQWQEEQKSLCSLDALLSTSTSNTDDETTSLLDVLSMPALYTIDTVTPAYVTLYDAIKHLSPQRRKLIAQHYGLLGHGAIPIERLAKSPRKRHSISQNLYAAKRMLAKYILQAEPELIGGAA